MELSNKKDNLGHSIVNCKFDAKELDRYSKASLEELASKLKIKGYRPGHVPAEVAVKFITNDELNKNLINRLIRKALKAINSNQDIIKEFYYDMFVNAEPAINVKKLDNDGAELDVSILLLPKVDKLAQYKGLKVEYTEDKFDEKLVEEELKRIQNAEGVLTPTEEALKAGDHVSLKIQVLINGVRHQEYEGDNVDLVLGEHRSLLGEKEEDIIGKKLGDKGSVNIQTGNNMPEELANTNLEIKYEIVSAEKKDLPAIDDELAKSQTNYKDCETLDALKAKITESIEKRIAEINKNKKLSAIYDNILSNTTFIVDNERIRKEILRVQEARDRQELLDKGITLEDYLRINNLSYEDYQAKIFDYVYNPLRIKAIEEAIYASDPETFKEPSREEVAKYHKMDSLEKYEDQIRNYYKEVNPEISEDEVNRNLAQQIGWLFSDYRKHLLDEYLISNND